MNLLKYFDLNRSIGRQQLRPRTSRQHWPVDRGSDRYSSLLVACWYGITQAEEGQLSVLEQGMMYCGVLLGVYFSGVIRGQDFRPTFLLAAMLALLIVPFAFEKLRIDPDIPLVVRFGLFVQNGVFWDVMLQAIGTIHR
ncbi:hypothetical protein ACN4EG_14960 [Alkalinema pantanalense CENA528]|uniref:hypothetical protein n=1 Tax=Alkalinema pantanalense TaxID=1620705 RepID=UPI003D7009E0